MALRLRAAELPGIVIITASKHVDERGFFSELYSKRNYESAGITCDFVQENQSYSARKWTIRGLHYQLPPCEQAKLVRVINGSILDVAVDIRKGSPSFGRHVAIRLHGNSLDHIFIPSGFAHGFCTLEDDTTVIYKVSSFYSQNDDCGLYWNDHRLGIEWPVGPETAIISEKDARQPLLSNIDSPFYF